MKLKKKLLAIGLCMMMISTQLFAQSKSFVINGTRSEVEVKIFNDMNYVKLTTVSQKLGYNIQYNNNTKVVTVSDGNKTLTLNLLQGEGKIVEGSTYVPLARIGAYFGNVVQEKVENGTKVIYITNNNSNNTNKSSNSIDSTEMKKVGVRFVTIDNEKVAALYNSAVYYTIGSDTIQIKYKLEDKSTAKLSGKVEYVNGVTVFPRDVMNYLYVEEENIDKALEAHGFKYEDVKDYWKKGNTSSDNSNSNTNSGGLITVDGVKFLTDGKVDNWKSLYSSAKSVVKTKLKDRNSAQFDTDDIVTIMLDDNGKDVWVSGKVRATNSYGAYITSNYDVMFTDGNWQKFSLLIDNKLVLSNQNFDW